MFRQIRRASVSVLAALCIGTWAGSPLAQEGQPETIENALQRHHVSLTRAGLIAALRDPDAEVRRLSAQKLAQDRDRGAIPAIAHALESEPSVLNRANLAYSLAELGAPAGVSTLRGICISADTEPAVRMTAAQYMVWLKRPDCWDAVVQVLESDSGDPGATIQALSLVPATKGAGYERIFGATTALLRSEDPGVRATASSTLGALDDASAVPYLEAAVSVEHNNGCLIEMQVDLQRLRRSAKRQ